MHFDHEYEILCVYECAWFLFISVYICLGLSITVPENIHVYLCVMSMSICECVGELMGSFACV